MAMMLIVMESVASEHEGRKYKPLMRLGRRYYTEQKHIII